MSELTLSLYESSVAIAIAIFVVAAIESVAVLGLILPGTIMMSAVAFQAGQVDMNVYLMLVSGALGAVVGDSISYWLGKTQCHRIPRYWPFSQHPSWLRRGQKFFDRHGGLSILIGRFVGPVRPLIPMIAGMMRMPQSRFFVVNVVSAIGWAPLYLLPGYCVGRNAHFSGATSVWIGGLLATFLVAGCLLSWGRTLLAPGSRTYYCIERRMRIPHYRRQFWNTFSSPTKGFPLGGFILLGTALPTLTAWTAVVWKALPAPLRIDTLTRDLFAPLNEWPWLHKAAYIASMIGDGPGLVALSAPWVMWWLWRRQYVVALHWMAGMASVPMVNWALKHLLDRPRPSTLLHSYSYPSSHTSGATIFCCMMVTLLLAKVPKHLRSLCLWSGITLAILMGLSRVVYGVHWLSDIIGGALLGLTLHAALNISYHAFAQREISWQGAWLPIIGMTILLGLRMTLLPAH